MCNRFTLTVFILAAALPIPACAPAPTPFTIDVLRDPAPLGVQPRPDDVIVRDDLHIESQQTPYDPTIELQSPLELSIEQAVMIGLHNNRGLRIRQLDPMIAGTFEQIERARFDPVVGAELSVSRARRQQVSPATRDIFDTLGEDQQATVGIGRDLPTGTAIDVDLTQSRTDSDRVPAQYQSRIGLTLTQALLRGARWEANVASIQQARLDSLATEYELRGFAEHLVSEIEMTFWEYVLADLEIHIFESSLELAEQQLEETRRRVEVGVMAETELAAALAEVALRREDLINARSRKRRVHLELMRLMNPHSPHGWDVEIVLQGDLPELLLPGQADDGQPAGRLQGNSGEPVELDPVADHAALARLMRPEINEARLQLERGRLEVVRTKDGLLPRLDFFLTLGKSGFADSFGSAISDMDGRGYDLRAGLAFSYPLGNRAAEADDFRARLTRQQLAESVANLSQLIDLDVRLAHLEVERAWERIDATRATRELREETVRAESEKFRVGTSTAFLVAQAQRDLLESRIAEARAAITYRQRLIDLYRAEGTLLLRRAIAAPGETPIEGDMMIDKTARRHDRR